MVVPARQARGGGAPGGQRSVSGWLKRCATLAVVAISLSAPGKARAQRPAEVWTVLPMSSEGMDPAVAMTFRDLLQAELVAETQRPFVPAPQPCPDNRCAQAAAAQLGANLVVYGMLRPLGTKIMAMVTLVDGRTGQTLASQSMSADRVEDLDAVAKRLARSLVTGTSPAANAELGTVTHQEEQPELRRGVDTSFMFRIGGIVPLRGDGYANLGTGVASDLGAWIEATHFAVEPRLGVRFDVARESHGSYFEFPVDLGAYYLFGTGDVAPLLGGGVGMHYLHETRREQIVLGSAIVSEHTGRLTDGGWGLAGFLRGGLLLARTYKLRVALTVDYNATFVELNGGNIAQSFVFGVSTML